MSRRTFGRNEGSFDPGRALAARVNKTRSTTSYAEARKHVVDDVTTTCLQFRSVEEMRNAGGITALIQHSIAAVDDPEVEMGLWGRGHAVRDALKDEIAQIRVDVQMKLLHKNHGRY